MAFQRYIHKHGRKLGPYYYENVRSPDGRVKTVYVGNSHRHPGHRIRKPLIFLILALLMVLILGSSLFFLQNKSYLVDKIRLQGQDFELDQILLKVLVRSNEFLDKQVRVMNTGSEPVSISAEVLGLADIVKIDSPSFSLKPGQTKVVGLTFSSFVPEQKIEQQAGVYIGKLAVKSQKASKSIPIIVEIETKNVLFDMNLNPLAIERKLKQGSDAAIEVRLFNLQSVESVNVDVEYFVKDINGNTILTESETVIVKTQASFFKTISVPKSLKPGPYIFAASSKFGNSVGTASYLFEVVGPEEESFGQFCKNSILCLGLSLTTLLLLFSLIAYFYFFIGAYLFERFSGIITLPRKGGEGVIEKSEEEVFEMPKPNIFMKIKERLQEDLSGNKLKRFYGVLDESKEAINKKDIPELNKLYVKARDLYVYLANQQKREVYSKLMELHRQKNRLVKEIECKKKLENEEERRRGVKEESGIKQIGLEAKQREREEKIRRVEEERIRKGGERKKAELMRQKEIERLREEAERKKRLEILRKEKEAEEKKKFVEKKRQEQAEAGRREEKKAEKEKARAARKKKVNDFLHRLGLYKTPEEKHEERLKKKKEAEARQKEEEMLKKEKAQERLAEEKKILIEKQKKEGEEKRRAQEEKRKQEELLRQKELEERKEYLKRLRVDAENRRKELEMKRKEQENARRLERISRINSKLAGNAGISESIKSELARLNPKTLLGFSLFKRLIPTKRKRPEEKEKRKEYSKRQKEEMANILKEVKNEPELKETFQKSRDFSKCLNAINGAKAALGKDNAYDAKRLYIEARRIYVGLGNEEKNNIYEMLTDLYNQLPKGLS